LSRIFYFTYSYPFGLGEAWKSEELMFLSDNFDEIIVVPYCFGGDKNFKGIKRDNIFYQNPIFPDFSQKKVWRQLLSILIHSRINIFLIELFKNKVYFKKNKLISWLVSTNKIIEISKNREFNKITQLLNNDDYAFFFWGRETSEYLGAYDLKAKKIIRFHGYDLYEYRHKGNYIPYQENQLKKADLILCISEDGKKYLSRKWNQFEKKIYLNLLGIINENPINVSYNEFVKGKLKIVTCSSLIALKRVHLLMEALILIKDIDIEWIHIGDGPEEAKLLDLSKCLSGNILFRITGWLSKNRIFQLYRDEKPNLFINLSSSEGLAVSIMEACSFGLPIIATNVGGTSELVDDNNGILLDKNITPFELSKTIKFFNNISCSELNRWSKNSFRKFKCELDANYTKRELIRLIKSIE
jgi:colanic acid/amylovoran biosynthesis glycosyltransferase